MQFFLKHKHEHDLPELRKKVWSCFIVKLFEISEKENFELGNKRTETDAVENV